MRAGDQIKLRRDESALMSLYEEEEQNDRILKLKKHCKRFRLMMPCLNFVVAVVVVIFLAYPVLVFVAVVFIVVAAAAAAAAAAAVAMATVVAVLVQITTIVVTVAINTTYSSRHSNVCGHQFDPSNLIQFDHNLIPGLSRLSEKSILSTPAPLWASQRACRSASCRLVPWN